MAGRGATTAGIDISPFFEVVKPRLVRAFDYQRAPWSEGNTVVMGDSLATEIQTLSSAAGDAGRR